MWKWRLNFCDCSNLLLQFAGDSDESTDEGDLGNSVQQQQHQQISTHRKPNNPNLAPTPRTSSLKPASRWKWEGGWVAGDRRTLRREGAGAQALTPEVEKAFALATAAAEAGAAAAAQKAAASVSPVPLATAIASPSSPTHSKDINDLNRNSLNIQSSPPPSTLPLLALKNIQRQPSKLRTPSVGSKDRGTESKKLYIKWRDKVSSSIAQTEL
jgi:hypothetical protein